MADFRKIARQVFKENANAPSNLAVTGRVPPDLDKFIIMAAQAYDSALTHTTYLAALGKRGYTQAAIEAEQAKLQSVNSAFQAHETAQGTAQRATTSRSGGQGDGRLVGRV